MIYIFHGDNQLESRKAFSDFIDQQKDTDILKLDYKDVVLDNINLFLQEFSLFNNKKILCISNFFSINKSVIEKIIPLINQSETIDVVLWQDKNITDAQLKIFKKVESKKFQLDNKLFACLNSIRPKSLTRTIPLYHQVLKLELYDLFLYLLKNNLKKQLLSYPKFDQEIIKHTYLQLIELDYKNKTGDLAFPKELALERLLVNLTK